MGYPEFIPSRIVVWGQFHLFSIDLISVVSSRVRFVGRLLGLGCPEQQFVVLSTPLVVVWNHFVEVFVSLSNIFPSRITWWWKFHLFSSLLSNHRG